ncbi:unnamed protein product [Trichogramma brassicae]|uniref:Uncharacterized protein n=1 Tax=Trichogramma brassicae TaxID=86971 RepID=A0A6H5HS52_9HYME|nr:unnamed protein product [Trichogramma brassicae]
MSAMISGLKRCRSSSRGLAKGKARETRWILRVNSGFCGNQSASVVLSGSIYDVAEVRVPHFHLLSSSSCLGSCISICDPPTTFDTQIELECIDNVPVVTKKKFKPETVDRFVICSGSCSEKEKIFDLSEILTDGKYLHL